MKKIFLLATSALLLLAGCAKEMSGPKEEGGLQEVTFTANMAGDVATKAAVDGDGAAASVNRCIMEIYYDDALFARQIKPVTNKQATFTCQVVANRTYKVAFWADHVTDASTEDGLAADLYYSTASLKTIALTGTYAGNNDARDAFFAADNYTIAQGGTACAATLYRPFAQVNVITTDWDKVSTVSSLKPDKVDVTIQSPLTKFNAVTGEASADPNVTSLNYNADLYTAPAPVQPVSTTEKTLSMDYLFAETDKAVIDIAWKAQKTGNDEVVHSFANIPYQRNYRTNIKGNLLTSQGQWTVTVDPVWKTPEADVKYASTLAKAQEIVQTGNTNAVVVEVKQEAVTNATTDDVVEVGGKKYLQFILKTSSPSVVGFELPEITNTDYERLGADTWLVTYETNYPTTTVTVDAPQGTKVKIEAPTSHVEVTGTTYAEITASTGDNTLVIPSGTTVASLIINKGGLEIHGTVSAASVVITGSDKVYVRACENLIQDVYDVLEPYIDVDNGYVGEKVSENNYRIYQKGEDEKVAQIGGVKYYTIAAAFAAVQDGQTIELLKNCSASATITIDKTVTLDLKTYTLTAACSGYLFDLNTAAEGKTFKITGTDASNCGLIVSNGTANHSGVACINASSSAVTFEMDYVKVHGKTEADVYSAGSVIISDNSTGRTDQINLTEVSINGNQDLVSGSDGRAYASINITGGVYSTTQRGFRFCGSADSESVIDGVNLTTKGGIAVYAFSTTTLQNSTIDMTATGNNDAVACSRAYNNNAVLTLKNNTIVAKGTAASAIASESKGSVIVKSGTYSNTNSEKYVVKVSTSGGTIDFQGGTVNAQDGQTTMFANTEAKHDDSQNPSKLLISGGTINGGCGVSSDNARVEIKGGTFKSPIALHVQSSQHVSILEGCTAVFEEKVTSTQTTAVTIPAGTFKKAIVNGDLKEGSTVIGGTFYEAAPYDGYIPSGYEVQAQATDPATWKVVELPSVAVIGTIKYQTLAAAFSAVKANETIKLTDNTTITSGITVSKTCTLDLNGFVISDNTSKLFTTSGSITFTITDNSANHDGKITTTDSTPSSCEFVHMEFSSPKLVINNGVFEMYASSGIMFRCQGTGAMCDINGGHFISGGTQTYVVDYFQNTSYNNQITGGTFEAISTKGSQSYIINMGGASGNYRTLTISGGQFSESGTQTKIFNGFKMSKVIIKKVEGRDEPEFSCTNTIFQGVFTLDISAGKFTGSGSFFKSSSGTNTAHSVISGGTFNNTSGKYASAGLFALNCDEQYFDITGGTFTSDVIYKIFYLHSPSYKKVITVTGGTFTENPAEAYRNYYSSQTGPFNLVPDGYTSTETSTGIWTVTQNPL